MSRLTPPFDFVEFTAPAQTKASAPVTVDEIRPIDKGALRAFVKFTIAGKVRIHDARVIQEEGKAAWVAMPQRELPCRGGGKSRWVPIVEITDKKLKEEIAQAVLAAWRDRSSNAGEGW